MTELFFKRSVAASVMLSLLVGAIGCGKSASNGGSPQVAEVTHDDHAEGDGHDHAAGDGHDHGGWWCGEHGVPEEVCSMCSAKAAAKFKEEGDWCDEHNRAESQCFKCDPTRAEKFAKLYEAKIGGQPPKPSE